MLTPVDIENKDFKKVMRGYDIYEVESFIKDVVSDYEKLYRENSNMKEKIEMLTTSITNYRSMEETMQSAMIVAQTTADDIKKNAMEKANNIVTEAEIKAKETVRRCEQEIADLNAKYKTLQGEIDSFKNRIKALIMTYDKLLDDFPKHSEIKAQAEEDILPEKQEEVKQQAEPTAEQKYETEPAAAQKPSDIYEELKKVNKRESDPKDMMPQNPRLDKQNALLDEILGKEKTEEKEPPFKKMEGGGEVREVVINLSGNGSDAKGSYYDVFKDNTL